MAHAHWSARDTMSDLKVLIVTQNDENGEAAPEVLRGSTARVTKKIDELGEIWDEVMKKLGALAEKSEINESGSSFQLESIEFNIGIEAGLNVGLVTKGNAAVSISFKRK